jgi:hypothetical protein
VNKVTRLALVVILGLGLIAGSGCIRRVALDQSDQVTNQSLDAPLAGATELEAEIAMGAGELSVEGDDIAPDALRGRFVYAPEDLEPALDSSVEGSTAKVTLRHATSPTVDLGAGRLHNEWDVTLPTTVPTRLTVKMGAGDGMLDLRGIDLTSLSVEQGAGEVTIDVSDQRSDLTAKATLGAGELTVRVPADLGVRVRGHKDGIGEWDFPGFTVDGDYVVNDAYGEPGTETIEMDIQRAVGQVNLVEVP